MGYKDEHKITDMFDEAQRVEQITDLAVRVFNAQARLEKHRPDIDKNPFVAQEIYRRREYNEDLLEYAVSTMPSERDLNHLWMEVVQTDGYADLKERDPGFTGWFDNHVGDQMRAFDPAPTLHSVEIHILDKYRADPTTDEGVRKFIGTFSHDLVVEQAQQDPMALVRETAGFFAHIPPENRARLAEEYITAVCTSPALCVLDAVDATARKRLAAELINRVGKPISADAAIRIFKQVTNKRQGSKLGLRR